MFNQKPSCCQESNKQEEDLQILFFGLIFTTKICNYVLGVREQIYSSFHSMSTQVLDRTQPGFILLSRLWLR